MPVVKTGLSLPGARSEFFDSFTTKSEAALINELATVVKSSGDIERYRWIGQAPPMREWGTGREAKPLYTEEYDIKNQKYEATLEILRDEISDDKTGQILMRIRSMAARAATHPDFLLATLLANGHLAANLGYDGQSFFSAAHSSGVSGAQSNILTPSAVDVANPTVAEFKTSLKAAIARLIGFLDDQGEPAANDASGLVCICTPGVYMTALEALSATVIDSTSNVLSGAAKVHTAPRLSDSSKYFLARTTGELRPFVWQQREPVEFKSLEHDSETGFFREVFQYGTRGRYSVAYGAWHQIVSCDFI